MHWVETEVPIASPSVEMSLIHRAIAARPDNPLLYARLGRTYAKWHQWHEAAQAYETALAGDPGGFRAWSALARCYLRSMRPNDALDLCRRDEARMSFGEREFLRGWALILLQRDQEGREALLLAVKEGHFDALRNLLKRMVRDDDGGKLLDLCDELPPSLRDTALARAHRAIALSRLGRTQEARQIVDLERYVAQVSFAPPPEFGSLEQFNRQLADDVLADRVSSQQLREDFDIDYSLSFDLSPALRALRAFIQRAYAAYLAEADERGFRAVMPAPPVEAMLHGASVVLSHDGHNGQHIHASGYISSVYYVLVPDAIKRANDTRGALALGCCDEYTGGYVPCWGTRYIKPVAGMLVIFPSHIFHDAVPSKISAQRISIATDMKPVENRPDTGAIMSSQYP